MKQSEEEAAKQLQREKEVVMKEIGPMKRPEPTLGDAIPNVVTRAKALLEWMPPCSAGSSGALRRAALEEAIEHLEIAWALARL